MQLEQQWRHGMTRSSKRALLLAGIGALIGITMISLTEAPGASRDWWNTNLWFFEPSIVSVAEQLEKRSPPFGDALRIYENCIRTEGCNLQEAWNFFDIAASRGWPEVFDHLMIATDWDPSTRAQQEMQIFFDALLLHGEMRLRNQCYPVIRIQVEGPEDVPRLTGFQCVGTATITNPLPGTYAGEFFFLHQISFMVFCRHKKLTVYVGRCWDDLLV